MYYVRNPHVGDKWIRGVVVSSQGSVTYSVRLDNGRVRKYHVDQMRESPVELSSSPMVLPLVAVPTSVRAAPEPVETRPTKIIPAATKPNKTPNAIVQDYVPNEVVDADPLPSTPKEYISQT